jgi:GT2 family glycosyltransferase
LGSTSISVIIPHFKRGEIFERGLDTVLSQNYENREIIVVDNHSEDDLKQRILARHVGIKLIELPENRGACTARNVGARAATGDILVFLEDDVGFSSRLELNKLVKIFDNRPDVPVVVFRVCNPTTGELSLRDWCHPRYWKEFAQTEFETNYMAEGASAWRREVFQKTGGYYEPLFFGAEALDMELRIMDEGYKLMYTPEVSVWHQVSERARTNGRPYYYFTRNYIWVAYKDYPLWAAMRFLSFKLAMMLYLAARAGCYRPFLRGLWDGLRGLRCIHRDRKLMSRTTMKRWANLEKGRPGLLTRMARHSVRPQL